MITAAASARWACAAQLWAAVVAWLRGLEPVLVYGPHGRAKLVRRRDAERLRAAGKVRAARSIDDARTRMGLPSVGIDADPDAIADTVDADPTAIGWDPGTGDPQLVHVPPRHAGTQLAEAFAGIDRSVAPPLPPPTPLTVEAIKDAARRLIETPPPDLEPDPDPIGRQVVLADASPRIRELLEVTATWTCEVCRTVHPIDHEGMILHACGGMICCSCERRWPEHQAACGDCRAFAEGRGTWAPPAPFDLSDLEE